MKVTNSKFNIQAFLLALCVFLSVPPYFLWHKQGVFLLGHLVVWYIPMAVAVIGYLNRDKSSRKTLYLIFFLAIILLSSLLHSTGLQVIFTLCLAIVPFLKKEFSKITFEYFTTILAIVFGISLFVFFGVLLGVGLPNYTLEPLNDLKKYTYTAYPMLVVPDVIMMDDLFAAFRFHGPFDEPGVVGTICSLILFIGRYNLRKWQNIIIFVAGIASLSLAFWGMSIIYGGIIMLRHNKRAVLAFLIVMPLIYYETKNIEVLNELVYSRFEYDSQTKQLKGNTRQDDELKRFIISNITSPDMLWGNSKLIEKKGYEGHFSIYIGVLIHGVVLLLLYAIFFVAYASSMQMKREHFLLFLMLLLATLYQRPQLFDLIFIYLFSTFIITNSKSSRRTVVSSSKPQLDYGIGSGV